MKRFVTSAVLLSLNLVAQAQTSAVTGAVFEEDSGQSVIQAGVLLLNSKDSSLVDGTVTDADGNFRLKAGNGYYILKVSCLGYVTQYRDIYKTASTDDYFAGRIALPPDSQMLKASTVAAKVQPLTIMEDTVVYNPAAFRVAEDASLEELLAKIPGLEISTSGSVVLHGKPVEEILVNGKRFFGGDVKSGLKNLSADMIENIKAYERESDFARISGVDDGEEVPVLDLTIKKSMLDGWKGRVRGGAGPADDIPLRYRARLNANKITKTEQTSVVAGATNVSGKAGVNTTSRSQLGYGSAGLQDEREFGLSLNRKPGKLEISANVKYDGFGKSIQARKQSESASATSSSFSASNNYQNNSYNRMKADATIEYRIDNFHTLYVRPVFNMTWTGVFRNPFSSSFSKDPLTLVQDPNSWLEYDFRSATPLADDPLKSIRVNSSSNRTATYNDKANGTMAVYYTIRSEKNRARNVSFRVDLSGNNLNQEDYNDYFVFYCKRNPGQNTDMRKQFIDVYENQFRATPQVSFNLPITKFLHLQGSLSYGNERKFSSRDYYSMVSLAPEWTVIDTQDRTAQKNALPQGYEQAYDSFFSSRGEYRYQYLKPTLSLRYTKRKFTVIAGLTAMPQWSTVTYSTAESPNGSESTFTSNFAPTITVRYNRQKTRQFNFTYRAWSSTPSLYNLLPVKSGTNPLSVHIGNPSLKPSYTHRINFSYNYSNMLKQTSFVANLQGSMTQNATSNSSEYVEETGGRINTAKNIDGNWNAQINYVFNKTLKDNHFSLSNHGAGEYQNIVSYLYNSSKSVRADEVNTMGRFMLKESFDFCYRNDILELIANAGGEYTDESSRLRPEMTQRPFGLKTGLTATLTFPWRMRFSTDYSALIQRGYMFDILNRNFHYLNAELSQSILKGKLVFRLDAYDILGQAVNMTRNFSASSRSISTYNGVGRYVIFSVVYRIH